MSRSRGVSARRGTARVVVRVVLPTILVRERRGSVRADTCRVTSVRDARIASARRTTSRVVIASTVFGTVSTTVAAGTGGRTRVGAIAGATGAATGRRVTMVPVGVCVTVVSTGSAVMVRVITVCALAALVESATASARLEAAIVIGFVFIKASARSLWG